MPEDAKFDPSKDPLLRDLPKLDGYCLLPPCAILGSIGRGGMGVVYSGRHVDFNIDVAIKCLDPSLAEQNPAFIDRFKLEAQAAAQINHQNVVRVFTIGESNGLHYLVMEYIEGETANQRVKRKGPLDTYEALQIVLDASRGLASAHEAGLIHRDVKPDNILISPKGAVKLADLGLAKSAAAEGGMTQTGTMLGTPKYMPLEQWQSAKATVPATDVYAMGATLWFLLVGRDAIEGSAPFEVLQHVSNEEFPDLADARPDVPGDIVAIVRKCTQKLPGDRYPSAFELVEALESIVRVDKTMLVDASCGSQVIAKTLVSPPPHKTLADIRVHFGTGEGAPAPAPESKSYVGMARVAALVLGLAALIFALGVFFGGDDPPDGLEEEGVETASQDPVSVDREEPAAAKPDTSSKSKSKFGKSKPSATKPPATRPPVAETIETQPKQVEVPPQVGVPAGWQAVGSATGEGGWFETVKDPVSGIVFRLIPSGTFLMGSPTSEEGRYGDEIQHWVSISKPFYLAETETSQTQWTKLMKNNPSDVRGNRLPVNPVSWSGAQEFCEKIGGALPTESQWEYACRAGSSTAFHLGETISSKQANYDGNYVYGSGSEGAFRAKIVNVRSFKPNDWGLYDMHGNAQEWCADWYGKYPRGRKETPVVDPSGPPKGSSRVMRGGLWDSEPFTLRSANRKSSFPRAREAGFGFRVARIP